MKNLLLSLFVLAIFCSSSSAQEKRINLYGSYVFDDSFTSTYDSYNYYNGEILGGFQYGAGIEFMPRPDMGVELLWIGQSTTAPMHYFATGYVFERYSVFEVDLNYAMLGFIQHMDKPGSKLEGYGGIMLGCLFVSATNPDNGNSGSAEKFAWGLKLGGNIWASERVGIKIQGQLVSAVQSVGGTLYFGTGGGGAAVESYSSTLQCSLGGGLVFRLGK